MEMNGKKDNKKAITILCCTILLLIGFVFLLDKTVIFRVSFDSDYASFAMPEILPVLYQGAIDNPKNSMLYRAFRGFAYSNRLQSV